MFLLIVITLALNYLYFRLGLKFDKYHDEEDIESRLERIVIPMIIIYSIPPIF